MSRKRTPRRHWPLHHGITGLPAGASNSPARDQLTTQGIKRLITAGSSPAGWSSDDANELIALANTVCNLMDGWPEYKTAERLAVGEELEAVLATIKRRRREHGHYGVTGDEWVVLKRTAATLQSWLETVPTHRLHAAEKLVSDQFRREQQGREAA